MNLFLSILHVLKLVLEVLLLVCKELELFAVGLFLESLVCFEDGYLLVEFIDRTLIFGLLFNLASLRVWLLRIRGPCQIERLGLWGLQGIDREARHHILSFEIHLRVVYLILLIHS